MIKTLVCTILFSGITLATYAQQEWCPSRELDVKLGYEQGLGNGYEGVITAKADYNFFIGRNFGIGLGAGFSVHPTEYFAMLMPITLNLSCRFPQRKCTPYALLQGGLVGAMGDGGEYGSLVAGATLAVSPSAGVKIPISKSTALDVSIGYTNYGLSAEDGSHTIFVKAGLSFGHRSRKNKDTHKHTSHRHASQ